MSNNYNACDFWRDLKVQFGANAKKIAFAYLDTITAQERRAEERDEEEFQFCCDLYRLCTSEER